MGTVKVLTSSGDNDSPLETQEYVRHYLYCDNCGSFKLKSWVDAENHQKLSSMLSWIEKGNILFAITSTIGLISLLVAVISDYYLIHTINFPTDSFTLLIISSVTFFLSTRWAVSVKSKLQSNGVSCRNCGEKFENGSKFFTDPDHNPMNFTIENVPLPRNDAFWIKG